MISLRILCEISGAPEETVRSAIDDGIITPVWHRRTLAADAETGMRWAARFATALAARQPQAPSPPQPPPTPAASCDPDPPADESDDADDIDDFDIGKGALVRTPRELKPKACLDPIVETALPGERLWSVTELAEAAPVNRNTILNAIKSRSLAVVSDIEATKPYLISDRAALEFLRRRAERRQEIRQRKAGRK